MGYFYNKLRDLAQAQGISIQQVENTVRDASAACDRHPENIAQALYLALKAYTEEDSPNVEVSDAKTH